MRGPLKKLLVLLLFFGLAGCMTSKKPAAIEEAFPGLPDGTEVVSEEPSPDTGDETIDDTEEPAVPEPDEVCTPVEIIPVGELPEGAVAGEEYETSIEVRGACGWGTCVLVSGPEWVTMDGCDLHALPNTAESLGENELTIRAQNMRNEAEFMERTLTLTVRDEPKINLFVSSSDSAATKQNVLQKDLLNFNVILGWNTLYARIEGHAESYTVALDEPLLQREDLNNNLYAISLADENERPSDEITITAHDTHGNQVERTFNIHFLDDPCDEELKIIPVSILKEDGLEGHTSNPEQTASQEIRADNSTDVILGTKYRIVFQVTGGLGPYEWSTPVSEVNGGEECPIDDPFVRGVADLFDTLPPLCEEDVLKTNRWDEVLPSDPIWNGIGPDLTEEEKNNKTYFQLETTFSFDGKALPYNSARDNAIYDRLHVEVTSSTCREHAGNTYQTAEYTLNHAFILPWEGVGSITCSQNMKDVGDTDSDSRMVIAFIVDDPNYEDGRVVASCRYAIHNCRGAENYHNCENPRSTLDGYYQLPDGSHVVAPGVDPRVGIDDIDRVEILFEDETDYDDFCDIEPNGCDHDDAEYDLISLTLRSNYRMLFYRDDDNNIDDNIVEAEGGHFIEWDNISGCVLALCLPETMDGLETGLYPLFFPPTEHGIWRPRSYPDYGDPPIAR